MKRVVSLFLLLLCVSSFSATTFMIYQHLSHKSKITNEAKEQLQELTRTAASEIDGILRQVMTAAEIVAADLSSGRLPKDEQFLKHRLAEILNTNAYFFSASITFKPYEYSSDIRLFSPYYKREAGALLYKSVETVYDYTVHNWYAEPLKQGGSTWIEPYFGIAGNTLMTSYSALFYQHDPKTRLKIPAGIVCIDVSLDQVKEIIESIELGPSGFGAITSRRGAYLYHPSKDYIVEGKTILSVANEHNDKDRLALGKQLEQGVEKHGIIDHMSITTGLFSWLAYEPIPAAGWSLQNTFIKSDIVFDFDILRHQLLWITSMIMLFIFSLLFLITYHYHQGSTRQLWLASAVISVVLIGGISAIWHLALIYEPPRKDKSLTILDRGTLDKLENAYAEHSVRWHTDPPVYLPTGIFISSVRLTSDNAALMTGYIWQKYGPSVSSSLSRAISIPSAEDVKITEIHRIQDKETEVLLWQFQARVNERMSFTQYPLDRETLTLQILHKDINHNIVLVPDIPGYKLMNQTLLPGLEKGVVIPGWTIEKAFFDLVKKGYDTNFGVTQSVLREDFPLLRYNIVVKRNFIDAFISNLTPLIVVAVMLFLLLLITTCNDRVTEKMRTGTGHTLSMSSALFFVVIFSHIGIRQRIQAEDIFYLEYFYFVIYAAILGVAISSILFAMAKNLALVQYKDNLVSKIAYWPSILGALFGLTLYVFY